MGIHSLGSSMDDLTQARCKAITTIFNRRPRKRYGYQTPEEIFEKDAYRYTSLLNLSPVFLIRVSKCIENYQSEFLHGPVPIVQISEAPKVFGSNRKII